MKYCTNCGAEVEGAKFCPKCGLCLEVPTQNIQPEESKPQTPVMQQKKKGFFQKLKDYQDEKLREYQESQSYQNAKKSFDVTKESFRETAKETAKLVDFRHRQNSEIEINQEDEALKRIKELNKQISDLKKELIETDENILMQSFGFYTPHYVYETSDEYKERLLFVRKRQKELIKKDEAVTAKNGWEIDGSSAKGKKMVKDLSKLILRAFNAECDDAVEHVRFNNIEACEKKINSSADAISKLGEVLGISITKKYRNWKIEELRLMHEYKVKKQKEKEEAAEIRRQQREEAKVLKEIEEARKKLEKEKNHYENALSKLNDQISKASAEKVESLMEKRADIESQISKIDKEVENVDYREANQKAGYVYVISNIGAFGEDVYKIGMTRRLDPMERVSELGDASVPFNFDVHAMIFTDDAPKLEAALHNAFSEQKLNHVNLRREFFHVTLDEIKAVVRENYDKTVEFVDVAPAEQYRESLLLQEKGRQGEY